MAPEGRLPLFLTIVCGIALYIVLGEWSLVFFVLPLAVIWLYRDPQRTVPAAPLGIISPVDGRVTAIGPERDRLLDREAIAIRIQLSLTSTFSIRSATEGRVMQLWQNVGEQRRSHAVWLQTDEEDDIVVLMESGPINRPRCLVATGERIGQGQRCGWLLLARRVVLYLPVKCRVTVSPGDAVRGGEQVLAELVHH